MSPNRKRLTTFLLSSAIFTPFSLRAQNSPAPVRTPARFALQQIAEPPVPADPLELVSGDAQPVQGVTQRASIINLLIEARRHGNVRSDPYDLKTSFTAFGSSGSDGAWQLEDSSPGRNLYRWTAQGPSYSAVNLFANRVLYSNQSASGIPLRLAQVRTALFFVQPMLGPRASLRTATASMNGVELMCALVSHGFMAKPAAGGRHWEEAEYCVDPKSLNLVTYSPVPGLYILYDYSKALHFHDSLIADKFTITQAGHTIIEAQTESVTDPPDNPALFQPAGLNSIGVGSLMTEPWRIRMMLPSPSAGTNGSQMVVLHGMQSPAGTLSDLEVVASTNPALNSNAISYTANWQGRGGMSEDVEGGATPQSHEVLVTLQYTAIQQ